MWYFWVTILIEQTANILADLNFIEFNQDKKSILAEGR